MKKYILSLFDSTNRLWTMIFLSAALVLIILSLVTGMENNLPMNLLFVSGIGFLYLALIHVWRKARYYLYLFATALSIFILLFIVTLLVSNLNPGPELTSPTKIQLFVGGLYTIIGLCICIPGMIIGVLGSLILGYRQIRAIKASKRELI